MANSFGPPGQVSPTIFSRTLERVFEDAQHTGEINLSGRKLKEYSKVAEKFDLVDTTTVDLSKNRFTEIPAAVTATYQLLEQLNCYHNMIRTIPASIAQLQSLVELNLSRNLLSHIPPVLCRLHHLEVLLATKNKLVSLPEEIAQLEHLMELDVSCNELTHLPVQIGDVRTLRRLNVRCNRLVELPQEICQLSLETLDCSSNKITHLPLVFHNMDAMERLIVADNPLVSPPAQLCSRGRVHITKYLQNEAVKEDRKRGILNEADMRTVYRQPASVPHPISNGLKYTEYPVDKRKYRQAVDSGYRSTDSLEKCRWSPSNSHSDTAESQPTDLHTLHPVEHLHAQQQELRQEVPSEPLVPPGDESPTTSLKSFASLSSDCWSFVSAVENPNKPTSPDFSTLTSQSSFNSQRSLKSPIGQKSPERTSLDSPVLPGSPQVHRSPVFERSEPHNRRSTPLQNSSWNSTSTPGSPSMSRFSYNSTPSHVTNSDPFAGYKVEPQDGLLDEFTRELQRQKSEYEAKKAAAAELRRQIEQEDEERRARERQKVVRNLQEEEEDAAGREREREERRRAAVRVQEEQKALMERQREGARREGTSHTASSLATDESRGDVSSSSINSFGSYQEPRNTCSNAAGRLVGLSQSFKEPANSKHTYKRTVSETPHTRCRDNTLSGQHMVGSGDAWQQNNGTARSVNRHNSYTQAIAPDEEFRQRREAMVSQQRHEAQMVRRRMEEDKHWIRKMQKDAVFGYVNRRTHHGKVDDDIPPSHDTSLNSSFTNSTDGTASPPPNFDDSSNGSVNSHISQRLPETCRRKLEAMSDEINSLNPAFTIRRQYQQAQEEREHIDMLRQIIESRLKVVLPENLPSALRDGVVLCHLANHLRPRCVASIHVPSHAAPKLSMAKCRKNVDSFLEACRRMGIDQAALCPAVAVLDENGSGLCDVALTVRTLVEQASRPSQTAV